jgi:hypothetical protein
MYVSSLRGAYACVFVYKMVKLAYFHPSCQIIKKNRFYKNERFFILLINSMDEFNSIYKILMSKYSRKNSYCPHASVFIFYFNSLNHDRGRNSNFMHPYLQYVFLNKTLQMMNSQKLNSIDSPILLTK